MSTGHCRALCQGFAMIILCCSHPVIGAVKGSFGVCAGACQGKEEGFTLVSMQEDTPGPRETAQQVILRVM